MAVILETLPEHSEHDASVGARMERRTMMGFLARRIRLYPTGAPELAELQTVLAWVFDRVKQYDGELVK